MGYKRTLRNILASPRAALVRKGLRSLRKGPVVFFYHGVEPRIADPYIQFLHLPLKEFEDSLRFLKSRYEIVSMDDLSDFVGGRLKLGPEHCLITFDDGYRNNLEVAGPVCSGLGLPFTVFISTGNVESGRRFPGYYLKCCIMSTAEKSFAPALLEKCFDLGTVEKKREAVGEIWRQMLTLRRQEVELLVEQLKELVGRDRLQELDRAFASDQPMSWTEVKKLAGMGATIGSHCHDHAVLHRGQGREETEYQLRTSKKLIEENLGECKYLSYPNGSFNDVTAQALDAARKAGYRLGFTTLHADVARGGPPLLLPRIGGSVDPRMLESHLSLAPVYAVRFRRWLKRF